MINELSNILDWEQVKDHLEYLKIDCDGKNGTGLFNRIIKLGIATHNVNIIIAGMLVNPVLTVALADGDKLPMTAKQALREHPVEATMLKKIAGKRDSATRINKLLTKTTAIATKASSGRSI